MVDTVTFSTDIGGTGETFTSGSDPTTGMGDGGYLVRFFKILANVIAVAAFIATKASEAAASALTALNAPGTTATSVTSNDVTGAVGTTKTWQIQSGKTIVKGMVMTGVDSSAPSTRSVTGVVMDYTGTALQLKITSIVGTGTGIVTWQFHLAATGAGAVPSSRAVNTSGLASGGADLTADRTITVPAATTAEARALASTTAAMTPGGMGAAMAPQALTDGATVDWDVSAKPVATWTLGGIRNLNRPTGGQKGRWYYCDLIQDGVGSRTIAWHAAFTHRAGVPLLSTGAGKRDAIALLCTDDTPGANLFDVYFSKAP